MIETVIYLIIALIVIGIVLYLLNMIIDMIPMDARFKQIAKVLLLLVAVTPGGSEVTFANVPAGTLLPIKAIRVDDTSTASNIVALW